MTLVLIRWFLFVINVLHLAVHGTCLDGGAIDALLVPMEAYFLSIQGM